MYRLPRTERTELERYHSTYYYNRIVEIELPNDIKNKNNAMQWPRAIPIKYKLRHPFHDTRDLYS